MENLQVRGKKNFNPRPREEGDKPPKGDFEIIDISIHALVKRATLLIAVSQP